jgi:hypothetical protein
MFTTANSISSMVLYEREYFNGALSVKQLPSTDLHQRLKMRHKVVADKTSIYCIIFDRTRTYTLSEYFAF